MNKMDLLASSNTANKYGPCRRAQSAFDIQDARNVIWDYDRYGQGVNKKLMRLAVDSRSKRQSLMYDDSIPRSRSSTLLLRGDHHDGSLQNLKITQFHDYDNARFPRMEAMSHFHYNNVDFNGPIEILLCIEVNEDVSKLDTGQGLILKVTAKEKSWIIKRTIADFIGLDRQIHRCLYDRRYSLLSPLGELEFIDNLTTKMVHKLREYLSRFSRLVGNNFNCGPILNWLELDNHGNHLVVMEADDSAINVPAIAAGRVLKRYQAQAADEITLEVGEFLSVIDMPPVEETIWWRGKKGYEVGFFPSHCIEILGDNDVTGKVISDLNIRAVSKRRGKLITFLRFFFKSRPSKDELMQNGILRERVFGCDLGERLALCGRDVPLILTMCSEVIDEHGIVDGIYRLSGILSNLQRLRVAFDNDDQPPNLLDQKYLNDIHCISSLLKTYFRELPNPLFTFELYDKFVAAINKVDDTEKTVAFHHVIQRLPPPHYRTMDVLLRHLNHCATSADETNMTAKNLAIVWAPNLLRPNMDDSVGALAEFRTQAIIVEYMIRNVDVFFNPSLASAAIAYYPESSDKASGDATHHSKSTTSNMGGTKLISLEEARQRVLYNRIGSEPSLNKTTVNSPRHKLRSDIQPPRMAASPISPLPTLLSLEEAQARSKLSLNVNRRGSADLVELRDVNNTNSPKRNKKWFGLFSKSKAGEDELNKTAIYRRKGSTRRDITISLPSTTSTINEPQSEEINLSSTDRFAKPSDKKISHSNLSIMQIEENLDTCVSADNDDLMSAIVSVTAKYTTVKDSKSFHRCSVTIGEPSEFRRMNCIENELDDYEKCNNLNQYSISSNLASSSDPKSNDLGKKPCTFLSGPKNSLDNLILDKSFNTESSLHSILKNRHGLVGVPLKCDSKCPNTGPNNEWRDLSNVNVNDEFILKNLPSSETIFQLVAVPRTDSQTKFYGSFLREDGDIDSSTEVSPFSSIPKALRNQANKHSDLYQSPALHMQIPYQTTEPMNKKRVTSNIHCKQIDQKYKLRQLSRTPEEKMSYNVMSENSEHRMTPFKTMKYLQDGGEYEADTVDGDEEDEEDDEDEDRGNYDSDSDVDQGDRDGDGGGNGSAKCNSCNSNSNSNIGNRNNKNSNNNDSKSNSYSKNDYKNRNNDNYYHVNNRNDDFITNELLKFKYEMNSGYIISLGFYFQNYEKDHPYMKQVRKDCILRSLKLRIENVSLSWSMSFDRLGNICDVECLTRPLTNDCLNTISFGCRKNTQHGSLNNRITMYKETEDDTFVVEFDHLKVSKSCQTFETPICKSTGLSGNIQSRSSKRTRLFADLQPFNNNYTSTNEFCELQNFDKSYRVVQFTFISDLLLFIINDYINNCIKNWRISVLYSYYSASPKTQLRNCNQMYLDIFLLKSTQ